MTASDRERRNTGSRMLGIAGAVSLAGYVGWNVYWLGQGRIPPAIFLALTGVPAPTTGGTRAMSALFAGDFAGMLHHNALALPLAILFIATLGRPWFSRPRRIPPILVRTWVVLLTAAWVVKLTQAAMK